MNPPDNVRRIVGCPGGGLENCKTSKLTELAARAAHRYGSGNVMAVSLTRTAARELAGRDGTTLDPDCCATLHAHALRALDVDPKTLAETPEGMRAFTATAGAQWGGGNGHGHGGDRGRTDHDDPGAVSSLHVAVVNHRARMTPQAEWSEDEREYHAVWQDWCAQTRRVDFTSLIERAIAEHVAPLGDPRVILVDEAQDLAALEFTLLMQWARDADSTVCVGDSQQAIFFFRGADPERLDALPIARSETLDQSWRCPRAVAAAAQQWAEQLPGPAVPWKARDADGAVMEAPMALRDAADTADLALRSAGDGTTMVLATCRYMLTPLVAQLRARGAVFHNPWRAEQAEWNPLGTWERGEHTPSAGCAAVLGLTAPLRGRFWTWGDLLALTRPMQATALARGAKAAIEEHCRRDEFGVTRAGETVPMDTLLTLLGVERYDPAAPEILLLDIDSNPTAVLDWYERHLLARASKGVRYALDVLRRGGTLTEEPRLVVGTVHSTKGGEADHVILGPELSKEAFYGPWLDGGGGRDAIVRTGYVACSRARETLALLEPGCPEYMPIADVLRERQRATT